MGNCESELQAAFDEIERKRNQILVVGYGYNGKQAAPKEFPHMVIYCKYCKDYLNIYVGGREH